MRRDFDHRAHRHAQVKPLLRNFRKIRGTAARRREQLRCKCDCVISENVNELCLADHQRNYPHVAYQYRFEHIERTAFRCISFCGLGSQLDTSHIDDVALAVLSTRWSYHRAISDAGVSLEPVVAVVVFVVVANAVVVWRWLYRRYQRRWRQRRPFARPARRSFRNTRQRERSCRRRGVRQRRCHRCGSKIGSRQLVFVGHYSRQRLLHRGDGNDGSGGCGCSQKRISCS
mmetsp:Transcript_10982/g.29480  ORF Transcript_10982/g.29480 Transcript_10982/m.29480 type:complete len:230 (+) Transcript_10982:927-1616(+)